MASPPPASLRDLYAPPTTSWSFAPPANGSQPDTSSLANAASSSSSVSSSHQWSSRPIQHPLFTGGSGYNDGGVEITVDVTAMLQSAVTFVLLKYATTAVALPWEVGKTLLQVQWVPRDSEAPEVIPEHLEAEEHIEEDEFSDASAEHDSYFVDPSSDESGRRHPPPRPTDERGYIVRQSLTDEALIPQYVIPVGSASGATGMMFRLKNFGPEGWLSLWKGLLTSTITDMLSEMIQPAINSALDSLLAPALPALGSPLASYNPPPLLLAVASHIITGFILSPLDLIRTRLIVQSADPRHRMYKGPLDAIDQILEHEGGIRGIYLHPHLLIPTLVDCTLRAIIPFALPAYIASYFRITYETHPVTRNMVELLGSSASLLITLPFETVRRRLQVQTRGSARQFKGCVELRPAPYNGIVDAFWHILIEERSDLPLRPRRRHRRKSGTKEKEETRSHAKEQVDVAESDSWLRRSGIGQLYRGLSLRMGASVFVFVLAMVVGGDEPDVGWAEL